MNKEKSIYVLNTLIEINNDRIEGYESASKETEETDLKTMFSRFTQTSEKCKTELVKEVQRLGGKPIVGSKITGKFFRVWMDAKAALTGKNRKEILNSCEYGEDVAIATYKKALRENMEDITAEEHIMLSAQQLLIIADHDKVKGMRDAIVHFH